MEADTLFTCKNLNLHQSNITMIPKIIKTENEYRKAIKRLEEIFDVEVGTIEADEAELLGLLIEKYEDEHYPIPNPDPIEAIEFIMEQMNIKPKDLVGIIGDKASVSKILNKKRKLTIEMVRNLHKRFNIPFDALINDYSLQA